MLSHQLQSLLLLTGRRRPGAEGSLLCPSFSQRHLTTHHPTPPPCSWFDLVVVLQTDNTVLWERLEKR